MDIIQYFGRMLARCWNVIQTTLRPLTDPIVKPLERRYEIRKAQQFAELGTVSDVDGLVEFLTARLDEDERIALAARAAFFTAETLLIFSAVGDARHAARHNPARVLREVEAKRRIIEWVLAQQTPNSTIGDDFVFPLYAMAAEDTL